ncbi:hypothetical protein [Jiangella asiatica]|uniref:Uncharacterized protein n=1 Tax=Jiangella asiatica TaxID=2530372 RepID=A0A4R5DMH7_9ACTN|nr:hypothetical protein [Jiangella asiatica]TDE11893.1 hypothetical protein E1269_09055 [Jiangella asiatica]
MTGPETLTRAQLVERIGQALGREIPYVELTHEAAIAELKAAMGEYASWYVDGRAELAAAPQLAITTFAE